MEYSISWGKPAFVGLDADSSKDLSNLSKEDVSAALTEAELEEDDYYYTRGPVYMHLTDGVWEMIEFLDDGISHQKQIVPTQKDM